MHYFDQGSYQSQKVRGRQQEQAQLSKHVQTSRGLQDSSEYIQNDSAVFQIREQLSQKCMKKGMFVQLAVAMVLVIILLFISTKSVTVKKDNALLKLQYEKYIHVEQLDTKRRFRLQYLNPTVVQPQIIKQQPALSLLQIPTNAQFINKVQAFPGQTEISSILFLNWEKKQLFYFQAEFYSLQHRYNMNDHVQQSSLCVISPFRNLVSSGSSWKMYLDSLNEQNYSNYHVFMIDDMSTDNSSAELLQQIKQKYIRLNNRIAIIKNSNKTGALGNRDIAIRNYCKSGDIIIDIDGDDALIGKQVFNVINRIYNKNKEAWFVYSNYLSIMGKSDGARNANMKRKMMTGISKQINNQTFVNNQYRTKLEEWSTSQLRTYLRDLYVKIPLSHLIEPGTRRYYIEASDRFSIYALTELAGKNHTFFIQQFFYFYFEPNYLILEQKQCTLQELFFDQAKARILTPLQPLKSLDIAVSITPNYQISAETLGFYMKKQKNYLDCLLQMRKKNMKNRVQFDPF